MSIHSNAIKNSNAGPSRKGLSAVALALGTLLGGPAYSAPPIVPWLNQPAPAPAQNMEAALPAPLRACTTADLHIILGQQGARHGFATQEIRLSNRSAEPCAIAGIPETQILPDNAAPQTVSVQDATSELATQAISLAPGQSGMLLIGTPGACEAATKPGRKVVTNMQLALPGGGVKKLDGVHIDTLCGGASVMRFETVPHNGAGLDERSPMGRGQAPLAQLSGVVTAPDHVNRGATVHYMVTLTNPTAASVALSPCPAYTQSFYADGKIVSNTMRLNCAASGAQIAANSSVSFEMQLPLHADLPAGAAKLSWVLDQGPSVGTLLNLR
ncbi:MAG TPA: DUF4232 domain-containing protein [Telluria sp.]|jgi:hypothetical protein